MRIAAVFCVLAFCLTAKGAETGKEGECNKKKRRRLSHGDAVYSDGQVIRPFCTPNKKIPGQEILTEEDGAVFWKIDTVNTKYTPCHESDFEMRNAAAQKKARKSDRSMTIQGEL